MEAGYRTRANRSDRASAIGFFVDSAVIIKAEARPGYRLWLRFADGAEGVVDLSDLAGRGVFGRWLKPGEFEKAMVDAEWGAVRWPAGPTSAEPELDLSPDMLHHRLTGEALPGSSNEAA